MIRPENRLPDWRNIATVLERKIPERATLFELFLNNGLIRQVSGIVPGQDDIRGQIASVIRANDLLGYDYTIQLGADYFFPSGPARREKTVSLNDSPAIVDRRSYDDYPWPDPSESDYSLMDIAMDYLPEGMKLMIWSADGLLETVVRLLGYDNLCCLLYDDPQLVSDVFEKVGSGYLEYFKRCAAHPAVMALVSSDDWGFNTQTMLSPDTLRKYLFPWQREYVRLAHQLGKYAVLHSCGNFESILSDVIEMGFDAKHSYQDIIMPVESAYDLMHHSIAVLGGLDIDFLARSTEDDVRERASGMLRLTAAGGGYALGSGNSIADYIPDSNYYAMIKTAWESSVI